MTHSIARHFDELGADASPLMRCSHGQIRQIADGVLNVRTALKLYKK
jgi:hypothetical protein